MGNYVNKIFSYTNETEIEKEKTKAQEEVIVEEDIMHTPTQTVHKTLPIDPRSVTTGIERTPIEVNCNSVGLNRRMISAIPKHLQKKPYLETDIDKIMLCLTPKKQFIPHLMKNIEAQVPNVQDKSEDFCPIPAVSNVIGKMVITEIQKERYDILGLDPRSPAADFDRTPILMPKSLERLKARSLLNLDRRGSYETDVFYSRFSYCETSSEFNVPEIQVLPDLAACTVKSLNLSNANCDDSLNESSCSTYSSTNETIRENDKNEEAESQNHVKATSEETSCGYVYVKKNVQHRDMNDHDTIRVWTDRLVLEEPEESDSIELDNTEVVQRKIPKEEIIITFDDDCIAKETLSLKKSKPNNDRNRVEITGKKKKTLKSEIKIATDEKVFNSNDKNGNESPMIRTPLGNRSNNGKVLSTNSPQQMLRNKGITPKMLQENTPPHKKYIVKSKLSGIQWDSDSTVII